MRKLDIQKFVEARGSRDVQELRERIEELLQILKEDEPAEVIEDGKVIKHIVSPSETKQSREQRVKAFWKRIDELAATHLFFALSPRTRCVWESVQPGLRFGACASHDARRNQPWRGSRLRPLRPCEAGKTESLHTADPSDTLRLH